MFCTSCGKQIPDGSKFCEFCGANQQSDSVNKSEQSSSSSSNIQSSPKEDTQVTTGNDNRNNNQQVTPPQSTGTQTARPHSPPVNAYTAPLSIGKYLLMFIVLMVPLLNLIMLFIWAFGSTNNINKKNFARAGLIMVLIFIAFYILAGASLVSMFGGMGGFRL